jgi:uncharacterized protein YkwD
MRSSISTVITAILFIAMAAPVAAEDSVGLQDPRTGRWYLGDSEGDVTQFFFGNPADIPFLGDWDCDGVATPGLYRETDGFVYLRNSSTPGSADISFFLGNPSDIPLAGDFNGDGCDTVSVYRPGEQRFYIANELGSDGQPFAADFSFVFGDPQDKPVAGDWDGDNVTEVGLYREATGLFFWRNRLTTGVADGEVFFGGPGDRFVAGDWGIVDGRDTPGVFRPSRQHLLFRNDLAQGSADAVRFFGAQQMLPVAGPIGDVDDNAIDVPREVPRSAATLVELLNDSRASECGGLPALTPSPALATLAATHSVDMVVNGFFGHASPRTGTAFDRLASAGIPWMTFGENIAVGYSLEAVHAMWMASPGHRANICGEGFGKIGIGVVDDGTGVFYAAQLFTN